MRRSGQKERGFTLAELLIVVAIIAVLTAESVPMFNNQLNKAKIAADQANVRSAKAAAVAQYLGDMRSDEAMYYYDAIAGVVQESAAGITGYGQYPGSDKGDVIGATGYPNENGKPNLVTILIREDGTVLANWGEGLAYSGKKVSSAAEYVALSVSERKERDEVLMNSLQQTIRDMTYQDILDMFYGGDLNNAKNNKVQNGEYVNNQSLAQGRTCILLAKSASYKSDGTIVDNSASNILSAELFKNIGYSVSENSEENYVIIGAEDKDYDYKNNRTFLSPQICVDLGIKMKELTEDMLDQKAENAILYTKGTGDYQSYASRK